MPVILLSSFAFFFYNQSICELLDHMPMSMFAVLGSVRRTLTIAAVTVYFGTPVTVMNIVGLCIVAWGFGLVLARTLVESSGTAAVVRVAKEQEEGEALSPCSSETELPSPRQISSTSSLSSSSSAEWLEAWRLKARAAPKALPKKQH